MCITDEQDVIDDYYVCEFPNWVNIVAVTPQNEVILVREYRYPIGEDTTAIPAGKVEDGEIESDAAARELKEETGFCTKDEFIFLGSFYTNAANATNKVFTYLATNVEQVTDPEKAVGEKTEAEKMTWEEIGKAIESGTINQVFSVLALKLAEDYLREKNRRSNTMKDSNCGYCMRGELLDKFGIFICDLKVSSLILFKEQSKPGRCIVAYKDHVSELIDLNDEERNAFMADVAQAARAIHAAFHPDKVNYGAYGDTGSHLHFHLVPKYKDGDEWGGTFQMNPNKVYLSDAEYQEMISTIKANL